MRLTSVLLVGAASAAAWIYYRRKQGRPIIPGGILGDFSQHFSEREFLSRGRPLAPGTAAAYQRLAALTLEPARSIAQGVAGDGVVAVVVSGQRFADQNAEGGVRNSFHLPPAERPDPKYRENAGVAADVQFRKGGVPLTGAQHAQIAERVRASMRAGSIPPGGVSAYHVQWAPGAPGKTPFIHFDSRGAVVSWE
jgi:hypothetical protein